MARAAAMPRGCVAQASPRAASKRRSTPRAPQRAPPAPAPEPLYAWPGSDALLRFIADAGGWVHPSLVVASRGGTGTGAGRGVFATSALPAGPIAYVPCAICPTASEATAGAAAHLWAPGGPLAALPALDAAERLALHLLLRVRAGGDGFTDSLPSLADGALRPFPIAWLPAQRAALRDPELAAQFAARRARCEAQHAALAAAALPGPAPLSLDEWLWINAMVLSRALRWHDGVDTSMQPFIDCVNHAPFAGGRNTVYDYVPAGADAAAWPGLPARAAAGGCAVLRALRPLAAGEEVLTSYAQEQGGGTLHAQAALARYGFLPPALGAPDDVSYDVHPAEARHAALELRLSPAFAAAAGDADAQLRAAGAALAAAAADDDDAARRAAAAGDEPARLAALYRRGRGVALGRAAMPHLPRNADGDDSFRAGVAAGIAAAARRGAFAAAPPGAAAAFQAAVWQALAGEEPPLMTPEEAVAAAAAS